MHQKNTYILSIHRLAAFKKVETETSTKKKSLSVRIDSLKILERSLQETL